MARHSWRWLAPRHTHRKMRPSGARAPSRPCISFEPLDTRVLLSGTTSDIIVEPPRGAPEAQVLVDLLKSGLEVTQSQMALFELLAPEPGAPLPIGNTLHKISDIFLKIDQVLFDLGDDLIRGELTEKKGDGATSKLEYLHYKLSDVIVSSYSSAVQESAMSKIEILFDTAAGMIDKYLKIEGTGELDHKLQVDFLKLSSDFLKIDDYITKAAFEFYKIGSPGLNLLDYQHKIDLVFLKVEALASKLDSKLLLPAVQQYQTAVGDLLGGLGGRGDYEGGVILLEATDDIIT